MTDKWVVYITHGVYVDADTSLDPDNNDEDYTKLRSYAVLKMWTQGYDVVKNEAEIEYENVTEEFNEHL
jgi:hypothetical protein